MSTPVLEGGCRCGAIRYTTSAEPMFKAICHCESCRRSNAAPVVAWAMFSRDQVRFSAEPKRYESSPGSRRGFCGECGTPLCFDADYLPGLIDLTIGSMDDPAKVTPQLHYWHSKRIPWLEISDDLPRHDEFPPLG